MPLPHELKRPLHGGMQGGGRREAGKPRRRERLAGRREEHLLDVRLRRGEHRALLEGPRVPADQARRVERAVGKRETPTVRIERGDGREMPIRLHLSGRLPRSRDVRLELDHPTREAVPRGGPAVPVDDRAPAAPAGGDALAPGVLEPAVPGALPAPVERPDHQTVAAGRVTEGANHPPGDSPEGDLPGLRPRARGVDREDERSPFPVADAVEAAPVAGPDREPQPVPVEVDGLSRLPAPADRNQFQAEGTAVTPQHVAPVRRQRVEEGGVEPLHEVRNGNGRGPRRPDPQPEQRGREAAEEELTMRLPRAHLRSDPGS